MTEQIDKKDDNNSGAGNGAGEEIVTLKKSEFEKINSDLNNYKNMGNLHKDKAEKWEAHEKAEKEKAEKEKANNNQNQNNNQGSSIQFDESKVSQITERTLRKNNEKEAQRIFFKGLTEEEKNGVLSELTFKGDETTINDIVDRLEAGLLEHRRKTGKLSEFLNSEKEAARKRGVIEGQLIFGHQGGAGDKNESAKTTDDLSPVGEKMANIMHVDPEKSRKVDPKKDNVIDVMAKKNKQ